MQTSFLSGPLIKIAALVPTALARLEQLRTRAYASICILTIRRPLRSLLELGMPAESTGDTPR
jgi:hypothetical protein